MRKFDNIHKFIFSLLISAYRGNIHKNSSFNIGFCVHHFRKLAKFYVLKNFRTFFIRDIYFFECWLVRIKDVFFGKCFESSQFSSRGIAVDPWTMCQPGFSKNEYFGTIVGTSSLDFTSLRGYMWDSNNVCFRESFILYRMICIIMHISPCLGRMAKNWCLVHFFSLDITVQTPTCCPRQVTFLHSWMWGK